MNPRTSDKDFVVKIKTILTSLKPHQEDMDQARKLLGRKPGKKNDIKLQEAGK